MSDDPNDRSILNGRGVADNSGDNNINDSSSSNNNLIVSLKTEAL